MSNGWDKAPCRSNPLSWVPDRGRSNAWRALVADAVYQCRTQCPVIQECAKLALTQHANAGVWAGVDLGDTGGKGVHLTKIAELRRIAGAGA